MSQKQPNQRPTRPGPIDELRLPAAIPPSVKAEIRKAMAFGRLREAAQALLDENTDVAQASYAVSGKPLTDADWRQEDERNFKLCREVRNALREAARCFPAQGRDDDG